MGQSGLWDFICEEKIRNANQAHASQLPPSSMSFQPQTLSKFTGGVTDSHSIIILGVNESQ